MAPKNEKRKQIKSTSKPSGKPQPQPQSQATNPTPSIPIELQQGLLNVFTTALPLAQGPDLPHLIQTVKGHLFKRDFAQAFGSESHLAAYALRWSASRALAYANIFRGINISHPFLNADLEPGQDANAFPPQDPLVNPKIVCLGGGAGAEVVALASMTRHSSTQRMTITAVDVADWSYVLCQLQSSLTEPPPLSQYASDAARAANHSLTDANQLHLKFEKHDILDFDEDRLRLLLAGASLVTIMFTLNELFATSIPRTTAFLLTLTDAIEPGSWLLVVDSPGSYSEISLGKDADPKRYPMKWLLDHALLQVAGKNSGGLRKWTKCMTDDSRWYRNDPRLKYPLDLKNMRYQIHLFRRQPNSITAD